MKQKVKVNITKLGTKDSKDESLFGKVQATSSQYARSDSKTDEIAEPVYSYENLSKVPETDDIVDSNIRAIAQNVVGFGYRFEQYEGDEASFKAQKALIENVFNNPNEQFESFIVISKLVCIDRETFGTGYIEARRDIDGNIARLYHAPTFRIRARKDKIVPNENVVEKRGYVMVSGKKGDLKPVMYFKNFGDERHMNRETGEYGNVEPALRASELIEFKNHNTKSRYYGVPQYLSTESAIVGNNYASTTNNNRFKNNCVPDQMVIVNNGSIVSGKNELKSYFQNEFKGAENAGKTLLIEVEGYDKDAIREGLEKATVQVVPLNSWKDSDFQKFQDRNDVRIRRSFRISKIILGETDDVNRAAATAAKEIAEEQVFSPIRTEMDEIINQTIVADILKKANVSGTPSVWFAFIKMKIDDPEYRLQLAEKMSSTKVGTINEIRETLGLRAFGDEEDQMYNTPLKSLELMLVMQALDSTTQEVKTAQMAKLEKVFKTGDMAQAYKMILSGYGVFGGRQD